MKGLGLISEALLKQLLCESGSISEESIRSYQEMAKAIVEGFSRAHGELRSISRGLVPGCGLSKKLPEALEALAKRTDQIHGIDLMRRIHVAAPKRKMLVNSMCEEALYAERTLQAGAMGYLCKQAARGTLVPAIRTLLSGKTYLSPEMTQKILTS